jgi:hypothetical protein
MTDVHLADEAYAIATGKARDAGMSLTDWLTRAIARAAEHEHRGPQAPVDDGGFPAVVLGHALHG